MKHCFVRLFLIFAFFTSAPLFSQTDSIFFKNKDLLIGEIKSMDRGVITVSTAYSKEDFKVKWVQVDRIITKVPFIITTSDGIRTFGNIIGSESGKLTFKPEKSESIVLQLYNIIGINKVETRFLDRLKAEIDLGFTVAKARNQRQLTIRSRVGYLTKKWALSGSFNVLASVQDETEAIGRMDANLTYIYFLQKDWFAVGRLDFLSNTEQKLDLRSNTKLGFGKFIKRDNHLYWNFSAGTSFNNERFMGEAEKRQSAESWFGSEVNLFDVGDISLLSNVYAYPSITEKGRVRVDYRVDLKYNLPLDFYIKTGLTWNYDNKPTPGAPLHDYVWQTTFGWSWK